MTLAAIRIPERSGLLILVDNPICGFCGWFLNYAVLILVSEHLVMLDLLRLATMIDYSQA